MLAPEEMVRCSKTQSLQTLSTMIPGGISFLCWKVRVKKPDYPNNACISSQRFTFHLCLPTHTLNPKPSSMSDPTTTGHTLNPKPSSMSDPTTTGLSLAMNKDHLTTSNKIKTNSETEWGETHGCNKECGAWSANYLKSKLQYFKNTSRYCNVSSFFTQLWTIFLGLLPRQPHPPPPPPPPFPQVSHTWADDQINKGHKSRLWQETWSPPSPLSVRTLIFQLWPPGIKPGQCSAIRFWWWNTTFAIRVSASSRQVISFAAVHY